MSHHCCLTEWLCIIKRCVPNELSILFWLLCLSSSRTLICCKEEPDVFSPFFFKILFFLLFFLMVPSHEFLPKEDVMKYLHFSLRSSRTLEVHAKFDNVRRDEWQDNEVYLCSTATAAHRPLSTMQLKLLIGCCSLELADFSTLLFPSLSFCRLWNKLRSKQTRLSCL